MCFDSWRPRLPKVKHRSYDNEGKQDIEMLTMLWWGSVADLLAMRVKRVKFLPILNMSQASISRAYFFMGSLFEPTFLLFFTDDGKSQF